MPGFRTQPVADLPLETIEIVHSDRIGERLPIAILLHGRGADNRDLADVVPLIDPAGDWRFFLPNAPMPFEPMPRYTSGFTWFDGWPPELSSIRASRVLLQQTIDALQQVCGVDDSLTALLGFSQGALMSIDSGLRRPNNLAALVVMSGGIFEKDLPDLAAHRETPTLLVHGIIDEVLPVGLARRTRFVMEEHGLQPEYHELQMGHQVSSDSMEIVREFLARVRPRVRGE